MESALRIARNPSLLDTVEDLLGPDILLWDGAYVVKEPHDNKYISWHQDLTYLDLDCKELVTEWVSLSTTTPESGCMKMLPGSQLEWGKTYHDNYGKYNILHRGQDHFNHLLPELVCTKDFEPAMVAYQAESEMLKHEVYDTN